MADSSTIDSAGVGTEAKQPTPKIPDTGQPWAIPGFFPGSELVKISRVYIKHNFFASEDQEIPLPLKSGNPLVFTGFGLARYTSAAFLLRPGGNPIVRVAKDSGSNDAMLIFTVPVVKDIEGRLWMRLISLNSPRFSRDIKRPVFYSAETEEDKQQDKKKKAQTAEEAALEKILENVKSAQEQNRKAGGEPAVAAEPSEAAKKPEEEGGGGDELLDQEEQSALAEESVQTEAALASTENIRQSAGLVGEYIDKNPGVIPSTKVRTEVLSALSSGNLANLSGEARQVLQGSVSRQISSQSGPQAAQLQGALRQVSGQISVQAESQAEIKEQTQTQAGIASVGAPATTVEVSQTSQMPAQGAAPAAQTPKAEQMTLEQNLNVVGEHLSKNPGQITGPRVNAGIRDEVLGSFSALAGGKNIQDLNASDQAKGSLRETLKFLADDSSGQPEKVRNSAKSAIEQINRLAEISSPGPQASAQLPIQPPAAEPPVQADKKIPPQKQEAISPLAGEGKPPQEIIPQKGLGSVDAVAAKPLVMPPLSKQGRELASVLGDESPGSSRRAPGIGGKETGPAPGDRLAPGGSIPGGFGGVDEVPEGGGPREENQQRIGGGPAVEPAPEIEKPLEKAPLPGGAQPEPPGGARPGEPAAPGTPGQTLDESQAAAEQALLEQQQQEEQAAAANAQSNKAQKPPVDGAKIAAAAQEASLLLNTALTEAAFWIWVTALPSLGFSILVGAILGDLLVVLKNGLVRKYVGAMPLSQELKLQAEAIGQQVKISAKIKLQIVAMNLIVIIVPALSFALIIYVGCNYPVPYNGFSGYRGSVIGLPYPSVCQAMGNATNTGVGAGKGPANLNPTPAAPLPPPAPASALQPRGTLPAGTLPGTQPPP